MSWFGLTTGLFGGIAVFLLGFERMTRAMQSVTGSRLADLLAKVSERPLVGALSGATVTAIIQSSSVTTVLTVGFVAAGMMTLPQAIGVIAGANLGTTLTVQIVAFDVVRYASLMVALGFVASRQRSRPVLAAPGGALLGLGLIFLGMDLMGSAMAPLRDAPAVVELLRGAGGPVVAVVAGAAFTALVQSSSAAIGIVVVLASQGLVDLRIAIAIALGAKIGTCVTAIIASYGQGRAAKRAALFHVLLNLTGALLWLPLIGVLADLAVAISPSTPELQGSARLAADVPRQLANAYTLFTAINLVLVIGFTRPIARALVRLVPDREVDPFARAHHLDASALGTPAVALELATRELGRLGRRVVAMVAAGGDAAIRGSLQDLQEVKAADDEVDELRGAIVTYLAELGRAELGDSQADEVTRLLAAADDLEAIGDVVATNLVHLGRKRLEERIDIAPSTQAVLSELHERVTEDLSLAVHAIEARDDATLRELLSVAHEVTSQRDAALTRQAERLVERGPARAAAYAREVELVAHLYRVHALTRRLARTQPSSGVADMGTAEA